LWLIQLLISLVSCMGRLHYSLYRQRPLSLYSTGIPHITSKSNNIQNPTRETPSILIIKRHYKQLIRQFHYLFTIYFRQQTATKNLIRERTKLTCNVTGRTSDFGTQKLYRLLHSTAAALQQAQDPGSIFSMPKSRGSASTNPGI